MNTQQPDEPNGRDRIRVVVWNEFRAEQSDEAVRSIYPDGIHSAIADGLSESLGLEAIVRTATLEDREQGLDEDGLRQTDVLVWWGHVAHNEVRDEMVERVSRRVLEGMGLIVLHSGSHSKLFRKLMGTSCRVRWRIGPELERIWCVYPGHPIAYGLGEYFELAATEMNGEPFDIPTPDELVFISWFEGGEVFRSGCCWTRGKGRIFYFRPGHETFSIYYDANVRRVIANAVQWAAPRVRAPLCLESTKIREPLSPITSRLAHRADRQQLVGSRT